MAMRSSFGRRRPEAERPSVRRRAFAGSLADWSLADRNLPKRCFGQTIASVPVLQLRAGAALGAGGLRHREGSMQPNMLLIGLGVLLILGGVVLMTGQTLRRGRLSDVTRPRASTTNATLEPQGRAGTL